MHISRSDDLLSRLSPQERRFAKRYLLCDWQLPPIILHWIVKLDDADGNQFIVFDMSLVALRSWRSISSSRCCRSCRTAMTRLPGSPYRALRMTWVYTLHLICQILEFLVLFLYCFCCLQFQSLHILHRLLHVNSSPSLLRWVA